MTSRRITGCFQLGEVLRRSDNRTDALYRFRAVKRGQSLNQIKAPLPVKSALLFDADSERQEGKALELSTKRRPLFSGDLRFCFIY